MHCAAGWRPFRCRLPPAAPPPAAPQLLRLLHRTTPPGCSAMTSRLGQTSNRAPPLSLPKPIAYPHPPTFPLPLPPAEGGRLAGPAPAGRFGSHDRRPRGAGSQQRRQHRPWRAAASPQRRPGDADAPCGTPVACRPAGASTGRAWVGPAGRPVCWRRLPGPRGRPAHLCLCGQPGTGTGCRAVELAPAGWARHSPLVRAWPPRRPPPPDSQTCTPPLFINPRLDFSSLLLFISLSLSL